LHTPEASERLGGHDGLGEAWNVAECGGTEEDASKQLAHDRRLTDELEEATEQLA
jgi:hypothetical protein